MNHAKLNVALLFGGEGQEADISCRSAAAVLSAIDKKRFRVFPVGIAKNGGWYFVRADAGHIASGAWRNTVGALLPTFPVRLGALSGFLSGRKLIAVDAVLPVLHGDLGEDGVIAGALRTAGLHTLGADTLACAVTADKVFTKLVAKDLAIPTLPFFHAVDLPPEEAKAGAEARFSYPMFVKPTRLGSSIGASVIPSPEKFTSAYLFAAHRGGGRVMIEPYVHPLRELEVAWFSDGGTALFAGPGEIRTGKDFYSFREKYGKESRAVLSETSDLPENTRQKLLSATEVLVRTLGLRDLCRADWFLTEDGTVFFNEINALPGLTDKSLYPRLLSREQLPMTEVLTRWIYATAGRPV